MWCQILDRLQHRLYDLLDATSIIGIVISKTLFIPMTYKKQELYRSIIR